MKLDRNINPDKRGKYALILLRKTSLSLKELRLACREHGIALDLGLAGGPSEFFLIRLKDKYAAPALWAYAHAAYEDDPEWASEVERLARKAQRIRPKKIPD